MRRIFAVLILAVFIIFIIGCKAPTEKEEPKLEVEIAEEDIETDLSEIDTLEEELDMPELDELDALIEELESD